MADRKISDLTALTTPATGDLIPIVDVSEAAAADKNKSITVGELLRGAPDGTAAAPGIAFESDGGNGMFLGGTDILAFSTGGTQAVTIDASQRLGVGTTSPAALITVAGASGTGIDLDFPGGISTGAEFSTLRFTASSPSFVGAEIRGIHTNGGTNLGVLTLHTSGSERLRIDSSGRVGINTTSPSCLLNTQSSSTGELARFATSATTGEANISVGFTTTNQFKIGYDTATGNGILQTNAASSSLLFKTVDSERARIDSSGRLLVGTSSDSQSSTLVLQGTSASTSDPAVLRLCRGVSNPASGTDLGYVIFGDSGHSTAASIIAQRDGGTWTSGSSQPTLLKFSTTADGASSPTERMRINSSGRVYIGTTATNPSIANASGTNIAADGMAEFSRSGAPALYVNRVSNDGLLVSFRQGGLEEGNISVSGSTVSYNGAHLSRWSQLPGGAERIEILRGSVLSNIDEMCEWGEEENEQLNRMQVSNVEGDRNVAGVFQAWDDDDDTYTNDFYCAMTGDFIIRIAQGVTVERGDLLMSAGDGTAKPQDDDIIRSKTIAKVTSTNVSCTYDDGSYCVPCVLMAC